MEEVSTEKNVEKRKLARCLDWLEKQNNLEKSKNVNDVQFIIQMNSERKKFLISAAEDLATVPDGIDEVVPEPKEVPLHKLRCESLHLQCGWKSCTWFTDVYEEYQKHVAGHLSQVSAVESDGIVTYSCLWDVCGHVTEDFNQMCRHVNFHAYHAKLLAVGFNGRATLKLAACNKDSTKRNKLPPLITEFQCHWVGCAEKFVAVQTFFDHVRQHSNYSDKILCSWAGCGAQFQRRVTLTGHLRSHTGERLIACYHCGMHFANNRRLADHLRRQNPPPSSPHVCSMCGKSWATAYLLREHSRRHVSLYACSLCDMSAPSLSALATHVAYRHVDAAGAARRHACPYCTHRSVTKWDLRTHIATHTNKKKKRPKARKRKASDIDTDEEDSESVDIKKEIEDVSDQENVVGKKKTEPRKYICHMCGPGAKVFVRGSSLTAHLVKIHGVQWPFGHSRFRYQISEDGMYRLTTTRYESLEVSKKIVDSAASKREPIKSTIDFSITKTSDATEKRPAQFAITIKDEEPVMKIEKPSVEIEMCDVDEHGNIISTEIINSEVVYE